MFWGTYPTAKTISLKSTITQRQKGRFINISQWIFCQLDVNVSVEAISFLWLFPFFKLRSDSIRLNDWNIALIIFHENKEIPGRF